MRVAGFLALGVSFMLVDYRRWWSGAPFRYVGMNSIVIYAGSVVLQVFRIVFPHIMLLLNVVSLVQRKFPFTFIDHSRSDDFTGVFLTHGGALASNIVGTALWCAIAYAMYRSKFFVKI